MRPHDCQQALSNLALAFPEVDSESRQKIFEDSVRALGDNFFDTLVAPSLLKREQFIEEEALNNKSDLVQKLQQMAISGRGVLILTGHLGCWELLGGWLVQKVTQAGLGKLAVVTGSIHNAPVDRLVQERRLDMGMKTLPRSGGAAPLLRHLQNGGVVAVLLDQNTKVENLPIPFFGQEAPTPVGFARIALRYGIPILPLAIARKGVIKGKRNGIDRGHIIRNGTPWIPLEPKEDSAEAVNDLLLWCNGSLEKLISRNPAEWVWFHERWSGHKQPSSSAED